MPTARHSWQGAVDFGGFNIHMRAYGLIKSKSAESFKTLCPCHESPVVAPKMCAVNQIAVDVAECGKGVKVGKEIKPLTQEAIDALAKGERTEVIPILALPERASVPLHLALKHFRFVPDKDVAGAEGPTGILWNGLLGSDRVLVSEWVARAGSRNELVAISADTHGLTGVVLPYVTDFNDVPEHAFTVDPQAAAMFEAFAAQQQINLDDFAHTTYVDAYGERRKKAIEAALAGKAVPTDAKAPAKQAVPDLMAAMSAALAGATPPPKKPARTKAPAKKAVKA